LARFAANIFRQSRTNIAKMAAGHTILHPIGCPFASGKSVKLPQTRYATSGDVRIAYQVVGQGSLDLVFVPGFISNLDVHWEDQGYTRLLQRLATFSRLILLDKRGTGLSDRVDAHDLPNLERRMDDVRAVMDAAGSRRAALLGASEGAPMSILFAATYPERTRALVLYGGYAHFHSWVMGPAALAEFVCAAERTWGSGASLKNFAPGRLSDERFQAWWARFERLSASPTAAIALARMNADIDVRHVLASIRVPTLIIHRRDDVRVKLAAGRYLAERISGARFVEIPGRDHPIWTGDVDRVVDELGEFLTGNRPIADVDRVLATLLAGRIAEANAGHRSGEATRPVSLRERAIEAVRRHGGHTLASGADEFAARFDGPARAVRCAIAIREQADDLGLGFSAGLHVGEVKIERNVVAGPARDVVAELAARAEPGEILVSGVVTDLVAGSGLHFAACSGGQLKDLAVPLRVSKVVSEQHLEPKLERAKRGRPPSLDPLTAREREVLALVADGLSNALIAQRLRLSDHTVKRHVANILLKLDLPTRAAAAAFLARQRAT
jgi:pimeloyl-ACP methyl ester carboxylesterase/DNA-binding CsgD family transcriptional regulator